MKGFDDFQSIPIGYKEFADLWNAGVSKEDPRRLSSFSYAENSTDPILDLAATPPLINNFFIFPDQVGLQRPQQVDPQGDKYARELADIMLECHQKEREGLVNNGSPVHPSPRPGHDGASTSSSNNHSRHRRPSGSSKHSTMALSRLHFEKRKTSKPAGKAKQHAHSTSASSSVAPEGTQGPEESVPAPGDGEDTHMGNVSA